MAANKNFFEGPDLERIGLFKEMSYLYGPIDPKTAPKESSKPEPESKGRQMLSGCTKTKDGTQQGYFDATFPRAFEGEGYANPIRTRRLEKLEKAKLNIGPTFKYTSPTKKQSGKGSNYGTFMDYDKKLEHFSSQAREEKKDLPTNKNFYVNPPKKGTGYGYANVTIGKMPPYFLEQDYEELKNESHEPKTTEPRPFQPYRAGIFQQQFFDPNPYGTDKEIDLEDEDVEETEPIHEKPFLPTSPAKKDGGMKAGCLNKFPQYPSEPYKKVEIATRGVKSYLNKENKMFLPFPGPKPYPIKSIITKNVERKITPQNFTSIKGVVYCKK